MAAHTVSLSTQELPNEIVDPFEVGPQYFLARIAQEEATKPSAAELREQEELAKYDGLFGDLYFLIDITKGLDKIGLEIPEDKQYEFSEELITRSALLSFVRFKKGEV